MGLIFIDEINILIDFRLEFGPRSEFNLSDTPPGGAADRFNSEVQPPSKTH